MSAIFKRDFKAMYTTPVGYVFGGIFLIIMYVLFYMTNLTGGYVDLNSLFSLMLAIMMFLLPILTMRLMSEETKQKTDQLLLTSPVSVTQIVTGKFFAALTSFIITLAGSLIIPFIIFTYSDGSSVWYVAGNYFAFIAAAASFIAIGLFISSLTENMLVSAILTWSVFLGLFAVDLVINFVDVYALKAVLGWISIFKRFSNFTMGVFNISDILYYASIAVVFVFLTSRVLEKKRYS